MDGISIGREKFKIRFILKDGIEGLVFILANIVYLSNSSSNFFNLGLLNKARIYHHNKDQILYNLKTNMMLAVAE